MKKTVTLLLLGFLVSSFGKGINYGPEHNDGATCQQAPQGKKNIGTWECHQQYGGTADQRVQKMTAWINQDLEKIKNAGFDTIKTFFSQYAETSQGKSVGITKLAADKGLNVMLGVFEFTTGKNQGCDYGGAKECKKWSTFQIIRAIDAAKKYPGRVKGIVVGNESFNYWECGRWNEDKMVDRIAADLKHIKSELKQAHLNIPVGTAQRYCDWKDLKNNPSQFKQVMENSDFVMVNLYPYWAGKPFKEVQSDVKNGLRETQKLFEGTAFSHIKIVIGEEGWPSDGNTVGSAEANLEYAKEYFNWWNTRHDIPAESFYFSAIDKKLTGGSGDDYFGLFKANGQNKGIIK